MTNLKSFNSHSYMQDYSADTRTDTESVSNRLHCDSSKSKPLRVLIVNWRSPESRLAGGAETHLEKLTDYLVKAGASVTLLTSGETELDVFRNWHGMDCYRIGNDFSFMWKYKKRLKKLVAESDFDLVIDDISKIPLGIHRFVSVPTMAWCHHVHGPMLYKELAWPMAWCADHVERKIGRLYKGVPILTVSESTRQELIGMGLNQGQTGLIPNGVDSSHFKEKLSQRSETPTLLYLGRLQRYKNADCVIRAMERVKRSIPDAKLVVAGTGKDEDRLRELARRICPGGVEFCGYVSEAKKQALLNQAWVSVATSMKEGWGICILEANAAGIPVIASNVPGHRDAIRDGETGWLYPFDDDKAMADLILAALKDESLRVRLGDQSRYWAESFTWKNSACIFLREVIRFYPKLEGCVEPILRSLETVEDTEELHEHQLPTTDKRSKQKQTMLTSQTPVMSGLNP